MGSEPRHPVRRSRVGALWYEFHQTGDFVDFLDSSVFSDTFQSNGWPRAPTSSPGST